MPESSLFVGKSAINQAVLSYAMREYHVGRPKVYMRDLFADPPQALRTDDSRKNENDVYLCCHELAEVGMLMTIDITVVRSASGDECLALGPSPAISITEKGLRYIEFLFSPND